MLRPTHRLVAVLTGGVAMTVVLGLAPAYGVDLAPAPTRDQLVAATNAMLQPADVPAPLVGTAGPFDTTGYAIPAYGDDPLSICQLRRMEDEVLLPRDDAVGYQARSGMVLQAVNDYTSVSEAQAAWTALSARIDRKCRGSWADDGQRSRVTATRVDGLAGEPQAWIVTSLRNGAVVQRSSVQRIGSSIQHVAATPGLDRLAASDAPAVDGLATTLAQRWQSRAELPLTQPTQITLAERVMVTPADLPANLPVTSGGSEGPGFDAVAPGLGPDSCNAPARIPAGDRAYSVYYGGDDWINAGEGLIIQQVEAYPDAAAASAAWAALTRAVLKCDDFPLTPASAQPPLTKISSGTSSLIYDGTPAVWSRQWDRVDMDDSRFSTKTYTVHLLVGDAIQQVRYSTSRPGIRQVPLDQVAVNELAVTLADRWLSRE